MRSIEPPYEIEINVRSSLIIINEKFNFFTSFSIGKNRLKMAQKNFDFFFELLGILLGIVLKVLKANFNIVKLKKNL